MGSLLSILISNVFSYLKPERSLNYRVASAVKNIHTACRSKDPNALTPYQSKIDNLPNSEVVYVSLYLCFIYLLEVQC